MERLTFRSTSHVDILAELRQRDLLREARARQRAQQPPPLGRTGWQGLRIFGRRLLG
jgi:hypothetical protein